MKPKAARKWTWTRRLGIVLLVLLPTPWLLFHLLSWFFPFPIESLDAAHRAREAVRVLDRDGRLLRAVVGRAETCMFWTDLEAISPRLVEATIAAEDGRFYSHPGVDLLAALRAFWSNVSRGRRVSGASTITMQVVRLVEPRPRTWTSKVVESFRALQIERQLDKRRILEWYLNLAPYGGNLVGVEASAQVYFGKCARDLTLGEAALLAGLPQAPSRLRPDRHPERARARRDWVLGRLEARGAVAAGEKAVACREAVRAARRPFPIEAPHAAALAIRRHPGSPVLRTTLDTRIQAVAETALRAGVGPLRADGVTNGAVVVIENGAAAVRALVGSLDFFAEADAGQVCGATAPRSPGSALKPFTYALAFDRGLCAPGTILADVPSAYGGYEPVNYDAGYRGPVTAREALVASLNVPAVRLLDRVGVASLLQALRQLGFSTLKKEAAHYGLALTLGSTDVTLLDLTDAYAALARLGVYEPCRLLEAEPRAAGRRVFSAGAAYLVADILSDSARLGGRPLWRSEHDRVRMAWKTGTSAGHRDAWTVAYTPSYTVGVWVGNFNGRPSRQLAGFRAAAPIAARILDTIERSAGGAWFEPPPDVDRRDVCAASGLPAGPICGDVTRDLAVRGRAPAEPCPVHRAARIDEATGTRLCAACGAGRAHAVRTVEVWPPEVAAWLRRHQPGRPLQPAHFAGCGRAPVSDAPPRILSPAPGMTYLVTDGAPPDAQRLSLRAAGGREKVYWFVDGSLVAVSDPLEPAFWPLARGRHAVVCADASGRNARVTIEVR
jgi:penicillin-binding protein 1C